jgi:hypothetical protein
MECLTSWGDIVCAIVCIISAITGIIIVCKPVKGWDYDRKNPEDFGIF